jgi:hypothetical protein
MQSMHDLIQALRFLTSVDLQYICLSQENGVQGPILLQGGNIMKFFSGSSTLTLSTANATAVSTSFQPLRRKIMGSS